MDTIVKQIAILALKGANMFMKWILLSVAIGFSGLLGFSGKAFANEPGLFTIGATGSGVGIRIFVDAKKAAKLLPAGLELASNPDYPAGQHPISMIFVDQEKFHLSKAFFHIRQSLGKYDEMVLAVNNVEKIGDPSHRYWYFYRVYVNSIYAYVGGRYIFDYNKFFGTFTVSPDSFSVTQDGKLLASVQFAKEETYDSTAFAPRYAEIKQELKLPVISGTKNDFKCSQFNWDFSSANAGPVVSNWILTSLVSPIFSGTYKNIPGLDRSASGGFFLQSRWELNGNLSCH